MYLVCSAVVATALLGSSPHASAAGLMLDAKQLTPQARNALKVDLDRAKLRALGPFDAVKEIAAHANDLDRSGRRPGMPLTLHFKALGPDALLPMLEMLAVEQNLPQNLTPTAQVALERGLIEAVGLVKDVRSLAVLTGILDKTTDPDTTFVAAEAIARLGTDDALAALTSALKTANEPRSRAILRGMGSCRRVAAGRVLAARLDSHPDAETARVLARSLGNLGNAWAWKTLGGSAEEAPARDLAARSLFRAFLAYDDAETRLALTKALLVVDAPATKQLASEARRGASGDVARALDDLAERVASNPAR
jgi:hypothetical protein